MHNAVGGDVINQRLLQVRIVVAVVQRARAGQKIDVLTAILIGQASALRLSEDHRERA